MDIYKPRNEKIEAEKLETDITLRHKGNNDFYLQGGNYLVKGPNGQLYPANKNLFEYLFEKEDIHD